MQKIAHKVVRKLVGMAIAREQTPITPCYGKRSFNQCVTYYNSEYCLWYNDQNNSTKIVKIKL